MAKAYYQGDKLFLYTTFEYIISDSSNSSSSSGSDSSSDSDSTSTNNGMPQSTIDSPTDNTDYDSLGEAETVNGTTYTKDSAADNVPLKEYINNYLIDSDFNFVYYSPNSSTWSTTYTTTSTYAYTTVKNTAAYFPIVDGKIDYDNGIFGKVTVDKNGNIIGDTSQVIETDVNTDVTIKKTKDSKSTVYARILHDDNGTIFEDLPWTTMKCMNDNEYFYNYIIPYDAFIGQYQIIYKCEYDDKTAYSMETFHVIAASNDYEDTVKVYGYVLHGKTSMPIEDARIDIISQDTGTKAYQSLTDREGKWEAYLYPGMYIFSIEHAEFGTANISAEIGDEKNELQFSNIDLDSDDTSSGTGMFRVFDKYITKNGTPLNNLTIDIYDSLDPTTLLATAKTDDDGTWEAYLNDGIYLIKLDGTSLGQEFKRTFRLKVSDRGEYSFEDISNNRLYTESENEPLNGDGSVTITDSVIDRYGNPIVDVQVNAYIAGTTLSDETIVAQDYTNEHGKWSLNLNPGNYTIEYYHPEFTTFTEDKEVK